MRKLLSVVLILMLTLSVFTFGAGAEAAPEKIIAGVFIRSLTNPYEVELVEGAKMFADFFNNEGYNIEVQVFPCDSSDEKQISDLKAFVINEEEGVEKIVFMITNTDPLMAEVAEVCEDAEVYWASLWNIIDGLRPDGYKYWVAHTGLDDYTTGHTTAEYILEHLPTPYEGKILAVQGMLGVTSATERFRALEDVLAEHPDVELLDAQTANWSASDALELVETWLSKYSDVDAIWCANDDMALGTIQALKAAGLDGKVLVCGADGVPGAKDAIQEGTLACTMYNNSFVQSGYMLTYCLKALTGEINTETMTLEDSYFNTPGALWTKDTIDEYIDFNPVYDFNDLAFCYQSPKPN